MPKQKLGVSKNKDEVCFAVYSAHAKKIELCLFSDDEKLEVRTPLTKGENGVWTAKLTGIDEGQKYGYRAYGPFVPEKGLYFNEHKLLVDPYAKDLSSSVVDWEDEALCLRNTLDSAHAVTVGVALDNADIAFILRIFLQDRPDIIAQACEIDLYIGISHDNPL